MEFITGIRRIRSIFESIQDHVFDVMNSTPHDKSAHKYSTNHAHSEKWSNFGNVSLTCVA